jgi:hypothetical protein
MSRPRLSWPLRALNRLGSIVPRWPALDPARLWDDAVRAVGDDRPWPEAQQALATLLEHADAAPLSSLGRLALASDLPTQLEQLLKVRRAGVDEQQPVLPPVFIVALPRTGTTLLHRLLSLHAHARWPRLWELVRPHPAPEDLQHDPRIALAETAVRQARALMPGLDQIHAMDARGPDECHFLLAHTSCSAAYDAQLPVPGYMRWFFEQDLRWTYRHHRRCLLLMQRHLPGAFWLLKTPLHLFGLDALREIYPDARLVVTHRAPREVAGSCCSLYASARAIYVPEVEPATLGAPWLETWGRATSRAEQALRSWSPSQVVHVDYRALLRDPVGSVEQIVERLSLPDDPGLSERVKRWSEQPQHHKDRHGAHRYELEDYGLRAEQVDERFSAWRALAVRAGTG